MDMRGGVRLRCEADEKRKKTLLVLSFIRAVVPFGKSASIRLGLKEKLKANSSGAIPEEGGISYQCSCSCEII